MKLYTVDDCEDFNIEMIHSCYKKYVSSGRVNLLGTFGFGNDVPEKAEGIWIYTKCGKKILDFTGGIGVLNHGHNHPRILAARKKFQDDTRLEVHRNFFSKYIAALGHNLATILPGDLNYSFFPNSGAEAVDAGLKTAFKYHDMKRDVILHSHVSFHGKLFGAASVTNSPENHYDFPKMLNCHSFEYNNLDSVKEMIEKHKKTDGTCNVAGLIIEPFNVSNMWAATPEFLKGVRELCTKNDIILMYDEIYSGWCKTGYLFNFMRMDNAIPDVLLMAKSFGGGKASLSGIVTSEKIFKTTYDNLQDSNLQTTTFYAYGEETITAIEAVNIIVEDDYAKKSQDLGKQIFPKLEKLKEKYPTEIDRIQGMGALNGVFFKNGPRFLNALISLVPGELYNDPRFINKLITSAIVSHLYDEHNVLTFTSLGFDIHLIISPPLIATEEDVEQFMEALDKTLEVGLVKLVLKFVKRRFLK